LKTLNKKRPNSFFFVFNGISQNTLAGLVLVNPTGLRRHRAQRPFCVINFVLWLYSLGPIARKIMHPLIKYFYNNIIGLRLDTGERAMLCVRTMASLEYGKVLRAHTLIVSIRCENVRNRYSVVSKEKPP
ncbi:hypothetical protein COOONC_25116, partial [Cooperia oncophora]